MTVANEYESQTVSLEIDKAVNNAQRLLAYIAWNGTIKLDPKVTEKLIEAKYQLTSGKWNATMESEFLMQYDMLAKMVYPVTIESIDATMPDQNNGKRKRTKAETAVRWYRRYTMISLLFLIFTQIYWIIGSDLRRNLQDIFTKREAAKVQITEIKNFGIKGADSKEKQNNSKQLMTLESKVIILNQQLDANYQLLLIWNRVWSLGLKFEGKLLHYFQTEYNLKKEKLTGNSNKALKAENKKQLEKLELRRALHEARMELFGNMLSADFALNALQGYVLPLLYGLLGAFIFVLRTLLKEIKSLTYSFDSEIRYRLRLTLGSLGGMIVGWFLKPEDATALASLSPMAIAFLMGYNVDVLFSIMDRFIDSIKEWTNTKSAEEKNSEPSPAAQVTPVNQPGKS